jgi:hypothetical protein
MNSNAVTLKLLHVAVFMAVMYVAIQVGVAWGIEKKSWLLVSWELVAGGSLGALAGLSFFILFGAIGWVCGTLYGAVGLFWLMVGGGLGGLGLGTPANIARNPERYNFHWPILLGVLVVGFFAARTLSAMAVRFLRNEGLHRRQFRPTGHSPDAVSLASRPRRCASPENSFSQSRPSGTKHKHPPSSRRPCNPCLTSGKSQRSCCITKFHGGILKNISHLPY